MKKWLMTIFGVLIFLVLVLVVWEFIHLKTNFKQQVYILPKGFKGVVLVAYEQEDGIDDEIVDGKLMYKIPQSGVLKVKRKEAISISQTWYYFEDGEGKRTELPYCFAPCDEMKNNPNKIFAFKKTNGGFENAGEKLEMTTFLVGTLHDSDSLNRADEKFNPLELLKNSR
jgi:hypothetical protein